MSNASPLKKVKEDVGRAQDILEQSYRNSEKAFKETLKRLNQKIDKIRQSKSESEARKLYREALSLMTETIKLYRETEGLNSQIQVLCRSFNQSLSELRSKTEEGKRGLDLYVQQLVYSGYFLRPGDNWEGYVFKFKDEDSQE